MSMTSDEAIRILSVNGWGYTDGELKEATQMATQALKEKSEAEELKILKKPIKIFPRDLSGSAINADGACRSCGKLVSCADSYCKHCGQALDWSEVEDVEN